MPLVHYEALGKLLSYWLEDSRGAEIQQLRQWSMAVAEYVEKFEGMTIYSKKFIYTSDEV